jgi:hypothetical protein
MHTIKPAILILSILPALLSGFASADEIIIRNADFSYKGNNNWSVNVTLQHKDSGWDHYADNWRIIDAKGNILGDRVLYHPHVEEQPFTRGLGSVNIPASLNKVYIEAHDKVHGWSSKRLEIDLEAARNSKK